MMNVPPFAPEYQSVFHVSIRGRTVLEGEAVLLGWRSWPSSGGRRAQVAE
jgi:hypothetical protein